jgi:hypothetical protein
MSGYNVRVESRPRASVIGQKEDYAMLAKIQALWPAYFARARDAAAGTPAVSETDNDRPDIILTAAATTLALLVVCVIAILLGMT